MKILETRILGAWIMASPLLPDHRGAFGRLFCVSDYKKVLGGKAIAQINHSVTSRAGTVRGLHYQQPPHAEVKIVRCLKGRVFDVAVDLRRGSATFMQWTAVELTPENHLAFMIPEGCAHGFQALAADSELLYLHTAPYAPDAEGGVRFDDPGIGVVWPLPPQDVSARDLRHAHLLPDYKGLAL